MNKSEREYLSTLVLENMLVIKRITKGELWTDVTCGQRVAFVQGVVYVNDPFRKFLGIKE